MVEIDIKFNIVPEEMAKVGVCFGHRTSKCNPKMKPYIWGVKGSVHIIDVEKSAEKLKQALEFIEKLVLENKKLILIGTKIPVKELIKEISSDCGLDYVTERWIGGTFTNFKVIRKRIDYFLDIEAKKAKGELSKYTKKERLEIDKDLDRFEMKFGGIRNLTSLPEAIFVSDIEQDNLAVQEARIKGIKIIAIADTNVDPSLVDYFIPANDDAVSSVGYILNKVKQTILAAKDERQKIKDKEQKEQKTEKTEEK